VHAAAALEKLDLGIFRPIGLVDQASSSRNVEIGEMAALKESNKISGGNNQLPLAPMHGGTLVALAANPVSIPVEPMRVAPPHREASRADIAAVQIW